MQPVKLLQDAWPYLIVGAPGLFAVWRSFRADRAQTEEQRASLITIAQEAASSVIEHLRSDADDLRKRIGDLENELADLRDERLKMMQEHSASIAAKDAQINLLLGEKRQLEALLQSYDALLTQHSIPHRAPSPYWEVTDGDAILQPVAPA